MQGMRWLVALLLCAALGCNKDKPMSRPSSNCAGGTCAPPTITIQVPAEVAPIPATIPPAVSTPVKPNTGGATQPGEVLPVKPTGDDQIIIPPPAQKSSEAKPLHR